MPTFTDPMDAVAYMAEATNRLNDRLLKLEGEALVHRAMIRQLMILALIENDTLKEAWTNGISANRKSWEEELASANEPTRKQIEAGLKELDRFEAEFDAEEPGRPTFSVIDGGKN